TGASSREQRGRQPRSHAWCAFSHPTTRLSHDGAVDRGPGARRRTGRPSACRTDRRARSARSAMRVEWAWAPDHRRPRSRVRVELVVLVELSDAGGETIPVACIADQQDGCLTGRRRPRRQHVFDPEVPVRGERNRVRVALDEWSHGFTYKRGALTTSPTCLHSNKMKIFSSRVSASAGHTPVIVRGERREVTQ